MDIFSLLVRPLAPSTTISSEVRAEAVRLFGNGTNRVAAYAYLYDKTGNLGWLIEAKVASGSGVLVGGPAWTFNRLLQDAFSKYPAGDAEIEKFSIEIGYASLAAIKPDPNNPGQFIGPSELGLYQAADSRWLARGIGNPSAPEIMGILRRELTGDIAGALGDFRSSVGTDYFGAGIKLGAIAAGVVGELTGNTKGGKILLDLLDGRDPTKVVFTRMRDEQWLLSLRGPDGSPGQALGVFDTFDASSGEYSKISPLSSTFDPAALSVAAQIQTRASIEEAYAGIIPAELRYYAAPADAALLSYLPGVDVRLLPGGVQTFEGKWLVRSAPDDRSEGQV